MQYYILLKSYSDAPDYEDNGEFSSKEEAVNHWYELLKRNGWDKDLLEEFIYAEEEVIQ